MPTQQGRVTIVGDAAQTLLAQKALTRAAKRLPSPLEDLLAHDYTIEFHSKQDFLDHGLTVPGGKKAAWGYVVRPRLLWVNAKIAAAHPFWAQYIVLHELGHAIGRDYLTTAKIASLKPLLGPRTDSGPYANRFEEAFADAWAEACGIRSPLDQFYRDFPDEVLPQLVSITLQPDPLPPVPQPEPLPLPLPDPAITALEAQVAALEGELAIKVAEVASLTTGLDSARVERDQAIKNAAKLQTKIANAQTALA